MTEQTTDTLDADIEAVIGTPIDETDREIVKSLQEFMRPVIFQTAEQTHAMARWLLASLLAVNGGAIIAALNSAEIGGAAERWAIASWLTGIVLALGSGIVAMFNGQRAIEIGSQMLARATNILHTGEWQDLRFGTAQNEVKRRGRAAIGIGILSKIAFIGGAILAAI